MSGLTISGVVVRFLLGGGAVAASYVLARKAGARWGGIFAAFPAVYLAAIITVAAGFPASEGLPLALGVSRGALAAMVSNILCAAAAAAMIPRLGWQKGLAGALGVWFLGVAAIYVTVVMPGQGGW